MRREVRVPRRRRRGSPVVLGYRCPVASRYGIDDHPLDARQPGGDLPRPCRRTAMRLAVVPVPVDGEEHARLDLAEAIEHALHAEIRRARRPHRAQARRAEHRDDRLGHVRRRTPRPGRLPPHPALSARPRPATPPPPAPRARHAALALSSPRKTSASPLSSLAPPREQILGEVEARVGKPASRRASASGRRACAAPRSADDAREIPERAPERLALVVRPAPERRVVGKGLARGRRDPAGELGDVRARDAVR